MEGKVRSHRRGQDDRRIAGELGVRARAGASDSESACGGPAEGPDSEPCSSCYSPCRPYYSPFPSGGPCKSPRLLRKSPPRPKLRPPGLVPARSGPPVTVPPYVDRVAVVAIGTRGTGHLFFFSCSWHERIIYRASGVKLILCGHGKGRRDLSAEHSMRITVGYGDPARGQARKLLR